MMTESQNTMGSNSRATNTRDDQLKGHRWLITTIVLGAIGLIFVLIFVTFLPNAQFERNRAKWDNSHITHYKMVVDFSGYGTYHQMPWTLEVQNDKVVSVINAEGDSEPVNDDAASFTVTALFVDIAEAYQRKAPSIRISYNPIYGYPERMYINPYAEPCCQDYDIEIRDFQTLP